MIRDLGLTHVRCFLLWEKFSAGAPIGSMRKAAGHLRSVCDTAADLGLRLQPTFFNGSHERPQLGGPTGWSARGPGRRASGRW